MKSLKPSYYNNHISPDNGNGLIVFNMLHGAIINISEQRKDECSRILNNPNEMPDSDLKSFLYDNEFLIDIETDELSQIKDMYYKDVKSNDVLYITITLTGKCNYKCLYCYQDGVGSRLDDVAMKKIFQYVATRVGSYKKLHVNWFGGEPLLEKKRIKTLSNLLIKLCDDLGIEYYGSVTTNGNLLNEHTAIELTELRVRALQFTLDGAKESHNQLRLGKTLENTFDKTIDAIKIAIKHGFNTNIRINLSPMNEQSIPVLIEQLLANGISQDQNNVNLYINEMKQHGASSDVPGIYYKDQGSFFESYTKALHYICSKGFRPPKIRAKGVSCEYDRHSSLLFGADGNIYHCKTDDNRLMHEVAESGEIGEATNMANLLRCRFPWNDEKCSTCKLLPLCMGGCMYMEEEGRDKCAINDHAINEIVKLEVSSKLK